MERLGIFSGHLFFFKALLDYFIEIMCLFGVHFPICHFYQKNLATQPVGIVF
jgi:hypothetical protein